jgi:two-component system response regulator FixJ
MPSPLVLVIDDDKLFRWTASQVLERAGYRVHEAATGEAGLDAARDCHPGAVLLDIRLPDLDGFTVLKAIRQTRPDLPVLMVTAEPTPETSRRAVRLGAHAHFGKPCEWALLLDALSQALQNPTPPRQASE